MSLLMILNLVVRAPCVSCTELTAFFSLLSFSFCLGYFSPGRDYGWVVLGFQNFGYDFWGLGEMFEGDFEDMCANKFLLVVMGGTRKPKTLPFLCQQFQSWHKDSKYNQNRFLFKKDIGQTHFNLYMFHSHLSFLTLHPIIYGGFRATTTTSPLELNWIYFLL